MIRTRSMPTSLPKNIQAQDVSASSAETQIDWRAGTYCRITLEADTTIVFAAVPPPLVVSITLLFIQGAAGSRSVTFAPGTSGFTTVYTEDGLQPLIQPAAGARSELQAVLDPGAGTLRIRQGVIGELAVS